MDSYLTALLAFFALIGIITLTRWVFKSSPDNGEFVLDHVLVTRDEVDKRTHEDKLKLAAERHGKPFKVAAGLLTYERVHRLEPRSHDLQMIDEASRKAREGDKLKKQIEEQTKITRIGKK